MTSAKKSEFFTSSLTCHCHNHATSLSKLQMPERILDAPELVNDYYLNLLDWSADNRLAVALGADVYLWNAGKIGLLRSANDCSQIR